MLAFQRSSEHMSSGWLISIQPGLSGSGRVDMPTRPVAAARAAVATGASGYIDTRRAPCTVRYGSFGLTFLPVRRRISKSKKKLRVPVISAFRTLGTGGTQIISRPQAPCGLAGLNRFSSWDSRGPDLLREPLGQSKAQLLQPPRTVGPREDPVLSATSTLETREVPLSSSYPRMP